MLQLKILLSYLHRSVSLEKCACAVILVMPKKNVAIVQNAKTLYSSGLDQFHKMIPPFWNYLLLTYFIVYMLYVKRWLAESVPFLQKMTICLVSVKY